MLALVAGGCGGSHHGSTGTSTGTTGTATTGTTGTGTTGTGTTGTATTGTGTAGTGTTGTGSTGTGTGPTHHRLLPANFTIGPGETISPQVVVVASSADVTLTVASGDGRGHIVLVRSAPPRSFRVPAGGRGSVRLNGLPDGNYVVDVDHGAATATLQVGANPAP